MQCTSVLIAPRGTCILCSMSNDMGSFHVDSRWMMSLLLDQQSLTHNCPGHKQPGPKCWPSSQPGGGGVQTWKTNTTFDYGAVAFPPLWLKCIKNGCLDNTAGTVQYTTGHDDCCVPSVILQPPPPTSSRRTRRADHTRAVANDHLTRLGPDQRKRPTDNHRPTRRRGRRRRFTGGARHSNGNNNNKLY